MTELQVQQEQTNLTTLNEFLHIPEYAKDRIILEALYLRISRALFLAKEKIAKDQTLQVVLPFADAALFQEMALSIAQLEPSLSIKTVGKLLSTDVMFQGALALDEGDSIIKKHMLDDDRLGKFDPHLPTLWIDSVIHFRIVSYARKLGTEHLPAGNPAILFSTESAPKESDVNKQRVFSEVWTPSSPEFISPETQEALEDEDLSPLYTLDNEGRFRLEMETAMLNRDKHSDEAEITLKPLSSIDETASNKYYFAVGWSYSPKTEERRKELIEASKNIEAYNQTEISLAQAEDKLHVK